MVEDRMLALQQRKDLGEQLAELQSEEERTAEELRATRVEWNGVVGRGGNGNALITRMMELQNRKDELRHKIDVAKLEKELAEIRKEEQQTDQGLLAVQVEWDRVVERGGNADAMLTRMIELRNRTRELENSLFELIQRKDTVIAELAEVHQKNRRRLKSRRRGHARVVTQVAASLRLHREMGTLRTQSLLGDAAPAA
ncbi:uncharacterized protein SPPG_07323 [Spizellomyces punctatus DAOM BR117]|uniref:Uncharacterized protein n=1 Tax=Spizellomyces punctatus (strain DAOM BR117) TaxID=645134 RepID=A0A0L0H8S1_SPIPD|nr:uncharacterized protein SPPG_07323 [Spizellomyces punctatus DAOM BR117]KNC97396.1 hypothetical protein SPPG_07323 [Spizellomyces punctatus DAOM BR117]|eukprot:XP_016605436.1 hypothetical protein SPPG_07323 [Spizellomyces punctatus DAOM BR117]